MIDPADPVELLKDVSALLASLSIRYCVGGSWACGLYGEPRMTRDLDLIVEMGPDDVERLAAALSPRFYVSREAMREAVAARRTFNAVDPESGFKVDFFVRGDAAFDLEEFARRREEAIDDEGGTRCFIKSPEDSVLRKLLWYRDGGHVSEQQWRDVLGVLAVSAGALDETYLDRWAGELRIADLLARARAEAAG